MKTENFGYKKLYIHGQLVDAENKKRGNVVCPANGETIAEIAIAGVKDTKKVLESSQKGFKYWSGLTLAERTEWMDKLRSAVLDKEKELRSAIIHEMGKTYAGSYEDIEALANALDWYPNAMKNYKEELIPCNNERFLVNVF